VKLIKFYRETKGETSSYSAHATPWTSETYIRKMGVLVSAKMNNKQNPVTGI
jgi:hypothetical protein